MDCHFSTDNHSTKKYNSELIIKQTAHKHSIGVVLSVESVNIHKIKASSKQPIRKLNQKGFYKSDSPNQTDGFAGNLKASTELILASIE